MSPPSLYAVTDRRRQSLTDAALIERAAWLAAAGVDMIQIRERDLCDRALVALVRAIVQAVSTTATRVLVNDRADIAVAAGAHGVHLRGDSIAAPRIRQGLQRSHGSHGSHFLIGRSVHSVAEAKSIAQEGGCDFLLFGTVFPSAGKDPGHEVAGLAPLAAAVRAVSLPVLAIGGIDVARAPEIAAAGAAGVGGVDVFWTIGSADEARARCDALCRAFDSRSQVQ